MNDLGGFVLALVLQYGENMCAESLSLDSTLGNQFCMAYHSVS